MLTGFELQRACLDLEGLSAPEKQVLTALAIRADGVTAMCTPGIARLQKDTGLGERTIQRAISGLAAAGHLSRQEKPGKGVVYTVHPRQSGTPATETPPPERRGTPARAAPKQPRTTNTSEAKASSVERPRKFILPEHIPEQPWADYVAMRRVIRKPMTPAAMDLAVKRLDELAEAGWPPGDVLNHSTLNSYQGLFAPEKENRNVSSRTSTPERPSVRSSLDAARGKLGLAG